MRLLKIPTEILSFFLLFCGACALLKFQPKTLLEFPTENFPFFWLFCRLRVAAVFGSFRPGGSVLKKKEESVASANIQAFGGPGAYGNPFPSFAGPPGLDGVR